MNKTREAYISALETAMEALATANREIDKGKEIGEKSQTTLIRVSLIYQNALQAICPIKKDKYYGKPGTKCSGEGALDVIHADWLSASDFMSQFKEITEEEFDREEEE